MNRQLRNYLLEILPVHADPYGTPGVEAMARDAIDYFNLGVDEKSYKEVCDLAEWVVSEAKADYSRVPERC